MSNLGILRAAPVLAREFTAVAMGSSALFLQSFFFFLSLLLSVQFLLLPPFMPLSFLILFLSAPCSSSISLQLISPTLCLLQPPLQFVDSRGL